MAGSRLLLQFDSNPLNGRSWRRRRIVVRKGDKESGYVGRADGRKERGKGDESAFKPVDTWFAVGYFREPIALDNDAALSEHPLAPSRTEV